LNPASTNGALTLDAEALYRELLRGVQQLRQGDTRLVGVTPAAPGWPSACRPTWACRASPA
jgi:hypothetical protein